MAWVCIGLVFGGGCGGCTGGDRGGNCQEAADVFVVGEAVVVGGGVGAKGLGTVALKLL